MRVAEISVYERDKNEQVAEQQRQCHLEGRSQLLDTPGKAAAEGTHPEMTGNRYMYRVEDEGTHSAGNVDGQQ